MCLLFTASSSICKQDMLCVWGVGGGRHEAKNTLKNFACVSGHTYCTSSDQLWILQKIVPTVFLLFYFWTMVYSVK